MILTPLKKINMKRLLILVLLICGIYFTQSILIANDNTTDNNIKIEQTSDAPQVKNCCKDVKVGEKCPVCGKVKKACPANCKKACCKKDAKASCCANTKVGEKCAKCGKVKKACPANCKKKCCKKKAKGCCAKKR
jgi:hypothetical protein